MPKTPFYGTWAWLSKAEIYTAKSSSASTATLEHLSASPVKHKMIHRFRFPVAATETDCLRNGCGYRRHGFVDTPRGAGLPTSSTLVKGGHLYPVSPKTLKLCLGNGVYITPPHLICSQGGLWHSCQAISMWGKLYAYI